jgi:hypothetical protein
MYIDILRTSGRGSNLPFEAALQEYSQFPSKYFLLVLLLFGVTVVNFVLPTTPEEKITRTKIG